ncbi:MAG: glutamate--tRNA ligase, partial [Acidimicrobiia bacterium]
MTVRVRFAPSPTGYLHVGAARTALYNYLFARANDGTFILRSDDTDRARSTDEYQADILWYLAWLGLDYDEGFAKGGDHGSYRQSDRTEHYAETAHDLVREGKAYYSLASAEDLDGFRKAAREAGTSPAYDGSLEPARDQISRRLAAGEQAVVRFKVPRPDETVFQDSVRGEMRFDHKQVDDFIILRSDGTPTYHLASTVDDVDYGITHVIRGEDLLSSTPKHILLTEALGGQPPVYAHLSLLMGPDGKKLSKRHGDTAMSAYRSAGFLPEAMDNYLALLGWSGGSDDDVVPLGEMAKSFDLAAVSRNPAVFDPKKLEWMNGVYIRDMSDDDFVELSRPFVEERLGMEMTPDQLATFAASVPLVKERTKVLTEVPDQVLFLLADVDAYDEASWAKVMDKPETPMALDAAFASLAAIDDWTTPAIEAALRTMIADNGLNARKGFQPIRVAISGSTVSPPLFESLELLGRDESLTRIQAARTLL